MVKVLKVVVSLLLCCVAASAVPQQFMPQILMSSTGCTVPAASSLWYGDNPSNLCGTASPGTTCTNGATMWHWIDSNGGNNAVQYNASDDPIYTTGAVNGHAALAFATASTTRLLLTSSIPTTANQLSFYAVVKITSFGANFYILGNPSGNANLRWGITTAQHQFMSWGSTSIIGTATLSLNTWYTLGFTGSLGGTMNLYVISGGSQTVDATGTQTGTVTTAATGFGANNSTFGSAQIAEIGQFNSVGLPGVPCWSQKQYGI